MFASHESDNQKEILAGIMKAKHELAIANKSCLLSAFPSTEINPKVGLKHDVDKQQQLQSSEKFENKERHRNI